LPQPNPTPPEYGLNRTAEGDLLTPLSLVELSLNDSNSTPLPSFGLVLYF